MGSVEALVDHLGVEEEAVEVLCSTVEDASGVHHTWDELEEALIGASVLNSALSEDTELVDFEASGVHQVSDQELLELLGLVVVLDSTLVVLLLEVLAGIDEVICAVLEELEDSGADHSVELVVVLVGAFEVLDKVLVGELEMLNESLLGEVEVLTELLEDEVLDEVLTDSVEDSLKLVELVEAAGVHQAWGVHQVSVHDELLEVEGAEEAEVEVSGVHHTLLEVLEVVGASLCDEEVEDEVAALEVEEEEEEAGPGEEPPGNLTNCSAKVSPFTVF